MVLLRTALENEIVSLHRITRQRFLERLNSFLNFDEKLLKEMLLLVKV